MADQKVKSSKKVNPMVYAYSAPTLTDHKGWIKIGYTEKQTPQQRVNQQAHTIGVKTKLEWASPAMYTDGSGEYFTDHKFHHYLQSVKKVRREPGTEWFNITPQASKSFFTDFAAKKSKVKGGSSYTLRREQKQAVEKTLSYFNGGGEEFLWNAKPRFGKTLTSYDLIQRMGCLNVLIITNRPAVANSWADDFFEYIAWRGQYFFVSETDSLDGREDVITREQYAAKILDAKSEEDEKGMIAFISLQDIKGSVYFGGTFDKLKWLTDTHFDLLIVAESQEGVETYKTYRAFRNIHRDHTLFLSGTPFKALASDRFKEEQIFNWTYADEQSAKENWDRDVAHRSKKERIDAGDNPYEVLPKMVMYTYQMSELIEEQVRQGTDLGLGGENYDYAFDLAEFFRTGDSGRFVHESSVKAFLHALTTQEKYPYSSPERREELSHTIWILNRVASCRALEKLLKEDPVFKEYTVVVAAGNGREETNKDDELFVQDYKSFKQSYDKVRKAIDEHDKTITLSVGQLTVGVTIPEWSGVLMLCNLKSASSYMQAAFRAQNPCLYKKADGMYRKETSYIFDFDPARTLMVFDEFANNLSMATVSGKGSADDRRANIKVLLNFFPVLGEDEQGEMVEVDASKVLSLPRKIKSVEVVRHQFMCNYLFQNISNVFSSQVVGKIIRKMDTAEDKGKEDNSKKNDDNSGPYSGVPVDDDGNVIVSEEEIGSAVGMFGDKIYADIDNISDLLDNFDSSSATGVKNSVKELTAGINELINNNIMGDLQKQFDLTKSQKKAIGNELTNDIMRDIEDCKQDFLDQVKIAEAECSRACKNASDDEIAKAKQTCSDKIAQSRKDMEDGLKTIKEDIVQKTPEKAAKKCIEKEKETQKHNLEDDIRAHLRGFTRSVPSFIMAYGDENLTIGNFDEYTEADVFKEVTGITIDEFRFLRDGGDVLNEETREMEHFNGNLFDEVVFNDSIQEFIRKKNELANYFEENQKEDIFTYIPPQKTNQIYTPQWVVKKMVDELEENNPGCFDNPDKTFADLYMKSGLFITEIVKRLYRSEKMKELIPDDNERIHHILEKQVYGMAPTRIIYLIARNYILGFDPAFKDVCKNFVQADAEETAKNGTLEQLEKD